MGDLGAGGKRLLYVSNMLRKYGKINFLFFKVPFGRVLRPQGLFFPEKSTFDFSKSLLAECYARRGFFFVKNKLFLRFFQGSKPKTLIFLRFLRVRAKNRSPIPAKSAKIIVKNSV